MSRHHDVLIIGGGLVGCAAAWMLAGEGADVCLVERDQVNQHASGQNAGSLHLQLEYRLVESGIAQARAAAQGLPLHLYSVGIWQRIGQELGDVVGLVQGGGLMVAETADQVRLLEQKSALERSWGLPVEVVAGDELRALAPYLSTDVLAAAHCPLEGKVNARSAGPALAAAALLRGARIATRSEVGAVERLGGRWHARVLDGTRSAEPAQTVVADTVIVAAGVWSSTLVGALGRQLPTRPVALMMTVTARRPPTVPHLVQHAGGRLSLKQTHEGNVLIGGGWPARFRRRSDASVDLSARPDVVASSVAGNLRIATRVAPSVGAAPVLRCWAGTTSITPDQLPLVGPVPGLPGLLVATSGAIFTLGPGVARALTDLVCGRPPEIDLAPYAPDRFASAA